MKRILLFLFIITSGVVYGQGVSIGKGRTDLHRWFDNAGRPAPIPPGYTKINARYEWIAGLFDTALHLPGYNGVPTGNRTGSWVGDGAIAMDTTTGTIYGRFNGTWVAAGGTTPGLQDVITQDPVITVDNTITNGKHPFLMTWNTLEDDEAGLSLYSQSTAGLSNSMLLKVVMIGAHSNINQTSYAGVFQNLHSGTGSSNVAGEFGAGNAETNYGLQVSAVTGSAASSVNYGVLSTVSGVGTNYGATFDASGGTDNFATWTKAGLIKIESQCLPTGASTDSIMTWEAATGIVRKRAATSITGVNIYNSDGTLTGDRTVTGAGFNLTWNNANNISLRSTGTAGLKTTAGSQTNDIATLPTSAQMTADGLNKLSSVVANQDSVLIQYTNDNRDSLSEIVVKATEIKFRPGYGKLYIDTLTFVPGTMALRYNPTTGLVSYADTSTASGSGATVALDNLSAVAINATLIPGTSGAIDLGSTTKQWGNLFLKEGGKIDFDNGDATITQVGNTVTLGGAGMTITAGDFNVSSGKITSTSVGGVGTGVEVTATGSANYASIDYLNDLGTRFQTGMYGSTAGSPGEAFFFHAAALPIGFYTNGVKRLAIASTGEIMMGVSLYVGSTSTTPTSTLQSGGSFAGAYVAKSANYTATVSDHTIECTANTFTVTLPTSVGITGRIYNIVNSGAGVITIATTSSQTFVNVVATPTTLTLSAVGVYQVQANGANWMVLSVN